MSIQGAHKIALPNNSSQKLAIKQILGHFSGIDTATKIPKEVFSADLQKDLLLLEEQEGSVNFKFGVIFMKPGQVCDDEMLSNGNYFYLISTKKFICFSFRKWK